MVEDESPLPGIDLGSAAARAASDGARERRLAGKVALITGGESEVARAVAEAYAREGASVALVAGERSAGAEAAVREARRAGQRALLLVGDAGDETFCQRAVERTVRELGQLDVVVNVAAAPPRHSDVMPYFAMSMAASRCLPRGGAIINTVPRADLPTGAGPGERADAAAAVVTFTRSLARALADRGIRVNAVALGPTVAPIEEPGARAPEDVELPPERVSPRLPRLYVFLASDAARELSGRVLQPEDHATGWA
ncbi:MAG: SDR family oxidoreductase [Thermomicrobiaceae bacterium]|nr:SDR family oxidoreductase [Thermomicrobiaceae bacterium]